MCGIAGIWGKGNIKKMIDALVHRGPDEEGIFESPDAPVKLGIRRLKVIDLLTGSQPIFNEDRTICIVYNGEVFNFKTLRKELEELGHVFYTQTDTEVIVHAYEQWGTDCLQRFNGQFAFAIWDGKKLFCARDRIGEKPFFYALKGKKFVFASEIKAILTQIESEPQIDEEFWVYDAPVIDRTLFKGIKQLPAAHYLIYDGNSLKVRKYWDVPTDEFINRTEDDLVEELRWLVEDSIKLRLISDVPLGMFLSGGLDSAVIACIAKPKWIFSCQFPFGEKYDEFKYAQIVAQHIGARIEKITPTSQYFKERLPRIMRHLEMPIATASSIAEFALAELASKYVKVVLGGQGADEIFSGYIRYLLYIIEHRLKSVPELANYHSLARYFWSSKVFTDSACRYFDLIKRSEPKSTKAFEIFSSYFNKFSNPLNQMGYVDLKLSLPSLLDMNDRAAASYGLENRCPFLDHRIVEFAFRLPPDLKIRGYTTKYILRRVARGLVPDAIIDRRDKKGLVVPINIWFNGELKRWTNALIASLKKRIPIADSESRGEFDRRKYTLVCLELWFREFFPDYHA